MLHEESIIRNIQSGIDVEIGFRKLVGEYKERVYWHARGIVGGHEDAADVTQNTFVKVYKNIGNFKRDSKFYTWLYRIATNESLNLLKKSKKHKGHVGDEELSKAAAQGYFDGTKAQRTLQDAIAQLPSKQKIVFNMKYFDEVTYNEMSEILETSVGALKASFHHAKNKIEAYIKEQCL